MLFRSVSQSRYFKVNDNAQLKIIDDAEISMKKFIDCSAVIMMQEIAGSVSDFFEIEKSKGRSMQLKERGFRQARSQYVSGTRIEWIEEPEYERFRVLAGDHVFVYHLDKRQAMKTVYQLTEELLK